MTKLGLFNKLVRLSAGDAENAIKRIANYYRQTKLYLSLCNSNDAYDFFIKEYSDDIKKMISMGHSYKYRNNYLIAADMNELKDNYPELYSHFFGMAPGLISRLNIESKKVMFINSFGPDKEHMTATSYEMIREFVQMYTKKGYIVMSDCTAGVDVESSAFTYETHATELNLNGNRFYRWG